MNSIPLLAFCLLFAVSCNSSDFAGASKTSAPKKKPVEKGKDLGDDPEDNPDDDELEESKDEGEDELGNDESKSDPDEDLEIDDAEKVNCDKDEEKIDAAGTPFTFTDEGQIRTFVNERCKTGISAKFDGAGAVGSDQATATAVCNLKGYKTATINSTGKYSSPHDNFIAYWDDAQKKFLLVGASGRNSKVNNLGCSEKFKTQCHDDKKKIDCVF